MTGNKIHEKLSPLTMVMLHKRISVNSSEQSAPSPCLVGVSQARERVDVPSDPQLAVHDDH